MVRTRRSTRQLTAFALLVFGTALGGCATRRVEIAAPPPPLPEAQAPPPAEAFEATAYSVQGTTAAGHGTRRGIVAADPRILPLGSRIRVLDAGRYSGTYTVADTGRVIRGRKIDIFIPEDAEARRFGKRTVQVQRLDTATAQP